MSHEPNLKLDCVTHKMRFLIRPRFGRIAAALTGAGCIAMGILLAAPAFAADPDKPPVDDLLTVTGTADVKTTPDTANLRLGVAIQLDTAGKASSENAAIMSRVLAAIRQQGIPDADIQTSSLDLEAVYQYTNNAQNLVGFKATNTVSVDVHDLTKVGPLLDAALGAGANQVEGISFYKKDDAANRDDALAKAAILAQDKARTLARALGITLGPVASVSEGVESRPVPMPLMGRMMAPMQAEAATPVQAGSVTVTASVTLQYHIRP